MATLLLGPPSTPDTWPPVQTATLLVVVSPIRSPEGKLRTSSHALPCGLSVAESLPARQPWERVVWNGGGLTPEEQTHVFLSPGDEVWAWPRWGTGPDLAAVLIYAAVSIAISLAVTALTYVLFPPSKPHIQTQTDEHTFSFEGIRTAIGPGNVVPVIYGRHRVGGQLLSASVEQALTVVDNGVSAHELTATTSPPLLSMLIAICEGPIDAILLDTIELNGQPLANFTGVELDYRLGTPDQSPMPFFGETRNTFADGREIVAEGITYTTTEAVQAFVLNIVFNEGLFNLTDKGDKETNTTTVAYRFRVSPAGAWSDYISYQVSGERTAPVRFGIRREGLGLAVYDLNVVFQGARHSNDVRAKWTPTLESVTEIQANVQAYPNTALLGIRAVATEGLQGQVPNVTFEVRGKTVRISTFLPVVSWSDSPAWCVMDFMTNTRYGLGIPDSDIQIFAFHAWALYCEEIIDGEQRHTFNYVLDREQRAQPLLLEMMGGSRTMMLKSQGQWTPHPTRDELPSYLISWTNCANVKLTYQRDPDRINVMEARYANEEDGFKQDVIDWPTIENWPGEVHKNSLEIRGVTKPSRIMRALQFELNRRRLENLTLEMDCSLEVAAVLQLHDLFRFSHPLPGWGMSRRCAVGSSTTTIHLDESVTMVGGVTYQLYLRYADDTTEARIVFNPGDQTTRTLLVGSPFSQTPTERTTTWAFGVASPDVVKVFRVTSIKRKSDTSCHLEAVIHNPAIYTEPTALALPPSTTLLNPLGIPPPLTTLILTELTRIQPSGASLRVVNLSWDVAGISGGFAPYGGAQIYRRTVLESALAGSAQAGVVDLGAIQDPSDPQVGFVPLTHVTGHVLDFDDFTADTGVTYLYRVVPVSQRGIPNVAGALTALIHVAGPTTGDYFPGTVRNLRLKGQPVGATQWEGRDVHLQWDPVADSGLFSSTFFVQDYVLQVWAPGQTYILRATSVPVGPPGQSVEFTYTFEQNAEDQLQVGQFGARRDLAFYVWARTNTGRISLDPAAIIVTNPPPDMSNILPDTVGLFEVAIISWDQFVEPRDFDHYEVHLDTQNPPFAIYQDISISFKGVGTNFRKVFPQGLLQDVTYFTYILPYDTFGPGLPSQIAHFTPVALTADKLDSEPPSLPSGLLLTTGTDLSDDGTIIPWVRATWTPNPEGDVAGYEVHVLTGASLVPTVFNPGVGQTSIQFPVPGNVTVKVKLLAFDRFHNVSDFTAEASITTGVDTTLPAAPTNLLAFGSIKSVALLWTPPSDLDYAYSQVWAASVNNRASATQVGTGLHGFVHDGLGANDTRFYWIRAVDTSGNTSAAFYPASATAGISGTAGQLDTTYISSLAADKLIAGTIQALVSIGTSNIQLDGVNGPAIRIQDQNNVFRVLLGKLGPLTSSWGLQIFNAVGQLMWNLTDGAQTPGISDAAITAPKIAAATVAAQHLRTDTAVITLAAQIANLIVNDAHISNVSADKIIAGTILALFYIGVGNNLQIDGTVPAIRIQDPNLIYRVLMGKLGPSNAEYGLQIFDQFGTLMWNFNTGAQTAGIAPAAVITEKIGTNAVTQSLLFAGGGGSVPSGAPPIQVASVTFPVLAAGDQVELTASGVGVNPSGGAAQMIMRLREDSSTGTELVDARSTGPSEATFVAQSLYTVPTNLVNKAFVVMFEGTFAGAIDNVRLKAIRLQR